jgi:hypothetical protein
MPIPSKKEDEDNNKFIARCMGEETMKKDYPDQKQRVAVCLGQTKKKSKSIFHSFLDSLSFMMKYDDCESCGNTEELTTSNFVLPRETDYTDIIDDEREEIDIYDFILSKHEYMDPFTKEIFYYDKMGSYKKNDHVLVYKGKSSEYQGRKVTLNRPFRTSDGPKKFSVYVKNEKGNVVKVNFGDPNMKIKKNIPERRRSFRARHNCDNPGPKWKARYWSCKAW